MLCRFFFNRILKNPAVKHHHKEHYSLFYSSQHHRLYITWRSRTISSEDHELSYLKITNSIPHLNITDFTSSEDHTPYYLNITNWTSSPTSSPKQHHHLGSWPKQPHHLNNIITYTTSSPRWWSAQLNIITHHIIWISPTQHHHYINYIIT